MRICVIGAGIVGLAVARDLTLRGVECVVVERGAVGGETTTHCAGMLHSGARYVVDSPELAKRCAIANEEVRRCAPFVVGTRSGLFVFLEHDPPDYVERFANACRQTALPMQAVSRAEALEYEPALSPSLTGAFMTRDTTLDPFVFLEAHVEELVDRGVEVWVKHKLVRATPTSRGWHLQVEDAEQRTVRTLSVDGVVNAAGPWAADVARAFGVHLPLVFINGSMVVLGQRFVNTIVTRCAPVSAGDVLSPSGNACLVGSTWRIVPSPTPEGIQPIELQLVMQTVRAMVPNISMHHVRHTYSGIRAHIAQADGDSAKSYGIDRTFSVVDHSEVDGVRGLVTALGGKLSLYRYVAELASDTLLRKLGISRPSLTKETPLSPPRRPSGRLLSECL
jgi:glycerol-3-phosphate dehydrogenase